MDALHPIAEDLQPVQTATGETWEQVGNVPADCVGPLNWDHPCAAKHQVINGVLVPTQPKRKKVCIVGYAENSRHLAWYNDPDTEIWGVNQLYRFIPRADRWFQIHTDWDDDRKWATGANLREWIQSAQCPVYMIDAQPGMSMTLPYPKAWVKEQLGVHEYLTSSIAMMLALAIAEGFEEIGIYGIDLIVGREYFFEKCCVEFYLGIAHAKGIKYHIPENSALLWQSHTYGYEMEPDYGFFGLEQLRKRTATLNKTVTEHRDKVHVMQGHLEEAELLLGKMPPDSNSAKVMADRVTDLRKEVDTLLNLLYLHDGAMQEVQRMYSILELRARGGSVQA
jgi:hypothetical protein